MMRSVLVPMAIVAMAAAPVKADSQAEIMAAMTASASGWNAGDLDRFMAVYAPDATFVTPSGLLRDKAAIADHYRKSFVGGGNARGKLTFEPLAFRTLGPAQQLLFARWTLTGAKVETGMTTLVFERRKEGWRIVADHSS